MFLWVMCPELHIQAEMCLKAVFRLIQARSKISQIFFTFLLALCCVAPYICFIIISLLNNKNMKPLTKLQTIAIHIITVIAFIVFCIVLTDSITKNL